MKFIIAKLLIINIMCFFFFFGKKKNGVYKNFLLNIKFKNEIQKWFL
jgi:hypothetical protein